MKKLKRCRDPDRFDLVALQRARREQVVKKDPPAKKGEDGGVFESEEAREAKRRKVLEDPFGPPL